MLDKRSEKKLEAYMLKKRTNLCRHIYIIHRYFNEWAQKQWVDDGWTDIRPEHLRLISIVGMETVNNNELAKRARVSKQAMSKMVADLESHGFVDVTPDPHDSRAKIISISNKGVEFFEYFQSCNKLIEKKFITILGDEKTDKLRELLGELTEGILKHEEEFEQILKYGRKLK
jgi:DNA-binding MarR family transcriptional regulator